MANLKLNNSYITVASFLAEFDFKLLKLPKALYETFIERVYSPSIGSVKYDFIKPQLIGSFQPFADIANDFLNTFTGYKAASEFGLDCLQPIFGIGNVLKGIFYLVTVLLLFIPTFIIAPILIGLFCNKVSDNMNQLFGIGGTVLLSWFFDGIGSLIRGSTELAATPLLIIKTPFRGIIALIGYINEQRFPKYDDEIDDTDWTTGFEPDDENTENVNSKPLLKTTTQNNKISLPTQSNINTAKPY